MDNNDVERVDKALTPEQAEAWIFTLVLGLIVCLGLVIYTLITHNLIYNYPDATLFKPSLVWLGSVGMFLYFSTVIVFWISSAIVRYLPNKIHSANIIAIAGLILFLISFVVLFSSYDLETKRLHFIGLTSQVVGAYMTMTKEIIEYKFNATARSWNLLGVVLLFIGAICLAFSIDT